MDKTANVLALLSTGFLAGAFIYGFFTVVPTFDDVPLQIHLAYRTALMRHNGIYVQVVMLVSILAPLWWAFTMNGAISSRVVAGSASVLAMTSFMVTRFGNVPINQVIKTWSVTALPPEHEMLLCRWQIFNFIRTAAAAVSFVCIVLATTSFRKR